MNSFRCFSFIVLLFFLAKGLTAQVTIGPEIGVSRAPLLLYGANSFDESKSFDLAYGINGAARLTDRWSLNLRVMYMKREDLTWQDLCFACDLKGDTYEHGDLNIDLDLAYTLENGISVGIGPSLVRKMNALLTTEFFNADSIEREFIDSYFGLNGMLSYTYRRFTAKAMYVRRFEPDDLDWVYSEGIHRLDFTVGYTLLGYRRIRNEK